MKLKLSKFANLAEIIGAFAVVASLIYVGIQVDDSNRAVRSASINDANVAVQQWYLQIGSDERASYRFYNSLMSGEIKSKETEFQFMMQFDRGDSRHKGHARHEALLAPASHSPAPSIRSVCRRIAAEGGGEGDSDGNLSCHGN